MTAIIVEVFKTNVRGVKEAEKLTQKLLEHLPGSAVNFDLEDCDKILRVKHTAVIPDEITAIFRKHGFLCEVLED